MKLTYYGHSCFAVEVGGAILLFDPFVTPNPMAGAVDIHSLPADVILISHGHFDHVADAVTLAERTGAQVISNFEICEWLGKQGIAKTHPMNHGGGHTFGFGRVKYVSAIHSSVLPDGSYGGNPGGFVARTPDGAFYYAGDTALTLDMKLIPEDGPLDFAVLPIGDNFTMGAEDAARAAGFVRTRHVVGVHYNTFPPIEIDRERAREAFAQAGVTLHLPAIGETIALPTAG